MSNKTHTLLHVKRFLPRMAFSARVALHVSVLFVVALFPSSTPGLGQHDLTESAAPVEQDESSEEAAIRVQVRTRFGRDELGLPLSASLPGGPSLPTTGTSRAPQAGHRLPNHLLAPLRC